MTTHTWGTHNGALAVRRNCDYCVKKKVRCSGEACCMMCSRKGLECVYSVKRKPGPKSRKRDGDGSPIVGSCGSDGPPFPACPPPPVLSSFLSSLSECPFPNKELLLSHHKRRKPSHGKGTRAARQQQDVDEEEDDGTLKRWSSMDESQLVSSPNSMLGRRVRMNDEVQVPVQVSPSTSPLPQSPLAKNPVRRYARYSRRKNKFDSPVDSPLSAAEKSPASTVSSYSPTHQVEDRGGVRGKALKQEEFALAKLFEKGLERLELPGLADVTKHHSATGVWVSSACSTDGEDSCSDQDNGKFQPRMDPLCLPDPHPGYQQSVLQGDNTSHINRFDTVSFMMASEGGVCDSVAGSQSLISDDEGSWLKGINAGLGSPGAFLGGGQVSILAPELSGKALGPMGVFGHVSAPTTDRCWGEGAAKLDNRVEDLEMFSSLNVVPGESEDSLFRSLFSLGSPVQHEGRK